MKLRRAPLRLATGAYILNSGVSKWNADDERASRLHGFASGAYPQVKQVRPEHFTRALSATEMVLGAALLTPFVSSKLVGVALSAFSAGLVGLYLRTPGMRRDGSVRPTQDGTALAKDTWVLGIGLSLLIDAIGD
jgi:hypothetical protein